MIEQKFIQSCIDKDKSKIFQNHKTDHFSTLIKVNQTDNASKQLSIINVASQSHCSLADKDLHKTIESSIKNHKFIYGESERQNRQKINTGIVKEKIKL